MDDYLFLNRKRAGGKISRLLFDRRDYDLLRIVNDVLKQDKIQEKVRQTYNPYFHANGIKELAESKGLRVAYAVASLVGSFDSEDADRRINALRALRHEVVDTAPGTMPKNTARVLLEIMKELVRSSGMVRRQLELAHDFRIAATGKPNFVRHQLKRYHLLEMPEEWNQIAFDDHVHDANTKGRKSSTHLIMDAWIKGIRRLRVIHYHFIAPSFARELLTAAEIMGIDIRIGIEFSARFRNKYVQLIWVPRDFSGGQDFLSFLGREPVKRIMEKGRQVSEFQQARVMRLFDEFNRIHLARIGDVCGIEMEPLDEKAFLRYVGIGQISKLHLSRFTHMHVIAAVEKFQKQKPALSVDGNENAGQAAVDPLDVINGIDIEELIEHYLAPEQNPDLEDIEEIDDPEKLPEFLRLSPSELLDQVIPLRPGFRITLNLTNLDVADVLEILYDCKGAVTRLEIFNLKDYAEDLTQHLPDISELQAAITKRNVIILKRAINAIIDKLPTLDHPDQTDRAQKLNAILHDIECFVAIYKNRSLKARLGSDSTGRSHKVHGMGLALIETLPYRAQRQIGKRTGPTREIIPVSMAAYRRYMFVPKPTLNRLTRLFHRLFRRLYIHTGFGYKRILGWKVQDSSIKMQSPGNIVTLGGLQQGPQNQFESPSSNHRKTPLLFKLQYLNSRLKNLLKVILGFIPAFATFSLTKDWWLLAYGGAFIWFAITGLRNILQSVLGGGGLQRSSLLRWNDYISWNRLTDSLMFTGFSVPLLDLLVKTIILDNGFNVTTTTHPIILYTAMSLANGVYLSTHNAIRGFPRTVIMGNFFRSVLSIPVAILLNASIGAIIGIAGVAGADLILQKWAAIVSKGASDIVAGFIEGLNDRFENVRLRFRDYSHKLSDLINVYSRLEVMFPETRTAEILNYPCEFANQPETEVRDLEQIIMAHALDLLYFWMYQPRARTAWLKLLDSVSEDEYDILITSQLILERNREISQMMIDGILGKDFTKALAFYLYRSPDYLRYIRKIAA